MPKSRDAFRTISEVADWLGIQAHVLRFWESKFSQVKPIKRAGGRRYYRPADMLLLGGIKKLLHDDGLTIKGVQKILREEGMSHVAAMSPPLEDVDQTIESTATETPRPDPIPVPEETGVVLNFEPPTAAEPVPEQLDLKMETTESAPEDKPEAPQDAPDELIQEVVANSSAPQDDASEAPAENIPAEAPEDTEQPAPAAELPAFLRKPMTTPLERGDLSEQAETGSQDEDLEDSEAEPIAAVSPVPAPIDAPTTPDEAASPTSDAEAEEPEPIAASETPQDPTPDAEPDDHTEPEAEEPEDDEPDAPPPPKPRQINLPAFTPEADFPVEPGVLAASYQLRGLSDDDARAVAPLLARLRHALDGMRAGSLPR